MRKTLKRVLSAALTVSMLASFVPSALAEEEANGLSSYFDFEATEYSANEADGELQIKIVRHGDGNEAADVLFKAADFISDYGNDYVILDSNGEPLEKVYGEKPELSELVYIDDEEDETAETEDSEESGNDAGESEAYIESALTDSPEEEITEETAEALNLSLSSEESTERKSTGSKLRDAQAVYLNLPETEETQITDSAKEVIDDMYNYFLVAEGAGAAVHFDVGETEQTITIQIIDNDVTDTDRLFMIALMGTNSENTSIAANSTTYVTISDDEQAETSTFSLKDDVTLTSDNPTGYVTVERTSGTQYFDKVYVSTVNSTAASGAYKEMDAQAVVFIPGETEKTVEVAAYDFSEDSKFGIRLEGMSDVVIDNYYVDVYIKADAESAEAAKSAEEPKFSLSDTSVTLGSTTYTPTDGLKFTTAASDFYGWNKEITGSDSDNSISMNSSNQFVLSQYDSNKYSMVVTKSAQNLIGVKSITYSSYVTNPSRGFSTAYQSYVTHFETDSDQSYAGSLDSISVSGNSVWTERTLELKNTGESAYLKFYTQPTASGYSNSQAYLDWVCFNYTHYTFSAQNSAENFNRKIYDFTQANSETGVVPITYDTYWDGATNNTYNPGTVEIKTTSGSDVAGFYGTLSDKIVITAKNKEANEELGIHLKGVYFANSSVTSGQLYSNGKYSTSQHVYYLAATDGAVSVTLNDDFIKNLVSNSVISNTHSDSQIKIFPVFTQDTVTVNFQNADRDDTNSETKGKYDSDNLYSHFSNIIGANGVTKQQYNGWLDYYQITVPKGSVIKVNYTPVSTRYAAGIGYWYGSDSSNVIQTYYKDGDTVYSSEESGTELTETDYAAGEVVADDNITLVPITGEQTFEVSYNPNNSVPDEYAGEYGLTNAIIPSDVIEEYTDSGVNYEDYLDSGIAIGSDADGSYVYESPYTGMSWSITALPPDNHYTYWVNMTGDTNGDGYIDEEEMATVKESNTMPTKVYGNRISGSLDQDNTKLYYYFAENSGGSGTKTGSVLRKAESFYEIVNNQVSSSNTIPVVGAYVDIAGYTAMTDGNGKFSVTYKNLQSGGNASVTVVADGETYYQTTALERDTKITLSALSKFTPYSLSASYAEANGIAANFIMAMNDTLTIKAVVSSSSAIVPSDARFYICDANGTEVIDCSEKDGYTTTIQGPSNNKLTATLTFNPKQDMKQGYKIYAEFADQNGEWTNRIDLGYYFMTELSVSEFIFPLIGSSSLENFVTTGVVADIIGNPLGDMNIGTLGVTSSTPEPYTPSGISEADESKYTWTRTSFSFGWSDKFYSNTKTTSEQSDDEKLKTYLKNVYNGTAKGDAPSASKFSTQSNFKWSITPSVGFSLTLSNSRPDNNGDPDGKTYFEDLVFYVQVGFGVTANQTIALPIGLSILIEGGLSGNITGVYHMYTNYTNTYETEGTVEYTSSSFGLFKSFPDGNVRREGYLFLDPAISVKLGIGVGVIFVTGDADFSFDMDFQFTESGTNYYGDMTIDLGWGIRLLGFDVYSNTLSSTDIKLFASDGMDGHIDVDYKTGATLSSLSEYFEDGDAELVHDRLISRDYLANRGDWLGSEAQIDLMSIDASEGTTETTLRNGTTDNPYTQTIKLDDDRILMVFIDDDTSRNEINMRTLYYTVYDGSKWSEPVAVDDDGTMDDYPTLCDLDNGKVLIAWSSAEKALDDGATVDEALALLNIEVAFFDKTTEEISGIETLTKTTDEDYTADVMPSAAYDVETKRLLLYYTKTEYGELSELEDISNAYSVNAYLYYDYEKDEWSNTGDAYTSDELEGIEDVDYYKENWYGQRFFDLRINTDSADLMRVVDSDAIYYNGLALFTWTVDWDEDLTTIDDRDVFMQIYNFSEDSFTHIIRVTNETGSYTTPKFARSDNGTYLFFGVCSDDDSYHSEIQYLNVSNIIKQERYTLVENGDNEYYIFQYTVGETTVEDEDGNEVTVPANTITITPDTATECDNPMNYDVTVNDDGELYLLWTGTDDDGESRQIFLSVYNGTDEDIEDEDNSVEDVINDVTAWSEPLILTNADGNVYYNGISASVIDDKIFVVGAKGDYDDSSNSKLVLVTHTPYSRVEASEVSADVEYPMPSSTVTLKATVKNEGIESIYPTTSEPITVTFTVNGEIVGTYDITSPIFGGHEMEVSTQAEMPEDISDVTISAYVSSDRAVTANTGYGAEVTSSGDNIANIAGSGYESDAYVYSSTLTNDGNKASNEITITAVSGTTTVGEMTIDSIDMNASEDVKLTLDIADSLLTINDDGKGTADVEITVETDDETIKRYEGTVEKSFDADAIELLSSVTDISFENNGKYSMERGDELDIQPEITGVDEDTLKVLWLESADEDIAYLNYENNVVGYGEGTVTLTGIVVPTEERIEFTSSTVSEKTDWTELIPEDMLVTVTAEVTVTEAEAEAEATTAPKKHSSGGGSSSKVTETPSPTEEPSSTEEPSPTEEPTSQDGMSSGSTGIFDDVADDAWYADAVEYVYENGIMKGVSDRIFEPDTELSRAMFITVIYRLDGAEISAEDIPFTDVEVDEWYSEAVAWGYANGIIRGVSDTEFAPADLITREQMSAMLDRYIMFKDYALDEESESVNFTDEEDISAYASDSVHRLQTYGIINGFDDSSFRPQESATRAQCAIIMSGLDERLQTSADDVE
ncbi:MAG: S-layer homology domain-containing protein [Oscillospiraceae bacterium]|nr:S-layer homology domain-containing protein [Oscillospiraceae bacterium]